MGYTIGDFLGRMVTIIPCVPSWAILRLLTIVVVGLFVIQILGAVFAAQLCASLVDPSTSPPSLITEDNYAIYGCVRASCPPLPTYRRSLRTVVGSCVSVCLRARCREVFP